MTARREALIRRLDVRVHEHYVKADREYPPGREFDADVRDLIDELVENDPVCIRLVRSISEDMLRDDCHGPQEPIHSESTESGPYAAEPTGRGTTHPQAARRSMAR